MVLGDPQADVGGAGDDARLRMRRRRIAASASTRARRPPAAGRALRRRSVSARASDASCAASSSSSGEDRRGSRRRRRRARASRCRTVPSRRTSPARPRRSGGSRCSGTGCPTARPRWPRAEGRCAFLYRPKRLIAKPGVQKPHCEPWHVDQRALHRMQRAVAARSDSTVNTALPVDRRQQPDARVDRASSRGACCAVRARRGRPCTRRNRLRRSLPSCP